VSGQCLVRIGADGSTASMTAAQVSGESQFTLFPQNFAPAFSNDGTIMYVVVTTGVEGGPVVMVGSDDKSYLC
jgi:hypothetical protein